MFKSCNFLILFLMCVRASAQFVSHGPVMGGVGPDSIRIYVRTHTPMAFSLQYSTQPNFASPQTINDSTRTWRDNSTIVSLTGLQPATRYYFRFAFNGNFDVRKGSFKTPPATGTPGHFVFAAGSCHETSNMEVFTHIPSHHPDMFIHMGDFTYPSYQQGSDYPGVFSEVELAYRRRYREVNLDTMLFNVPIDYINDDDDGFGPSADGWYGWTGDSINGVFVNQMVSEPVTMQMKTNCTNGYLRFFPGYTPVDTTGGGLYHKFSYGNCDFFFLDTRNLANSPAQAFHYDSTGNYWTFAPSPQHSIVGDAQMQWLLNELQNSTAQWKFLVGGVPFNPRIRRLIDVGMMLQNFVTTIAGQYGSGMRLAVSFSGYWAGYPNDIQQLLGAIQANEIKNVVFVSGDTHHNVMDNGANSSIPELNASGLSVTSTELAYQLNSVSQMLGYGSIRDSLWNEGGNGIGNENFKNGFGKIEVFGNDSLKLCVIDEDNTELSCFTIKPGYVPGFFSQDEPAGTSVQGIVRLYPNPADNQLTVELDAQVDLKGIRTVFVMDVSGKVVRKFSPTLFGNTTQAVLPLDNLVSGTYFLCVDTRTVRHGKAFVVRR